MVLIPHSSSANSHIENVEHIIGIWFYNYWLKAERQKHACSLYMLLAEENFLREFWNSVGYSVYLYTTKIRSPVLLHP